MRRAAGGAQGLLGVAFDESSRALARIQVCIHPVDATPVADPSTGLGRVASAAVSTHHQGVADSTRSSHVEWVPAVKFVASFADIGGGYNADRELFGYRASHKVVLPALDASDFRRGMQRSSSHARFTFSPCQSEVMSVSHPSWSPLTAPQTSHARSTEAADLASPTVLSPHDRRG